MYIIMTDLYSCICFFKQKTAYDVRISDSSSYVCSSDLKAFNARIEKAGHSIRQLTANLADAGKSAEAFGASLRKALSANVVQNLTKLGTAQSRAAALTVAANARVTASANNLKGVQVRAAAAARSEEHTSELQSIMRISYAVICLKKQTHQNQNTNTLRSQHMNTY